MDTKNKNGSVLILTLIVVTFLSALALQLSHTMRAKARAVQDYQDDLAVLDAARNALGNVINAIESDKEDNEIDHYDEEWMKEFMRGQKARILEWRNDRRDVVGEYSVHISDESGRININTVGSDEFERLLGSFEVARRIIDYRDRSKKSKTFTSIHELMMVGGISDGLFLGEERSFESGLQDYVTVLTNGKVNLNTASSEVLLSMPGIDDEMAEALIKRRKERPFAVLDDVKEAVSMPDETFAKIVRWANVRTDWYKVIVRARNAGSDREKIIIAYIDRSGDRAKIKYWREN